MIVNGQEYAFTPQEYENLAQYGLNQYIQQGATNEEQNESTQGGRGGQGSSGGAKGRRGQYAQDDSHSSEGEYLEGEDEENEDSRLGQRLNSVENGVQKLLNLHKEEKINQQSQQNAQILGQLLENSDFAKAGPEARNLISQMTINEFIKAPGLGIKRHFESMEQNLKKVYPVSKGKKAAEKLNDRVDTEVGGGGAPGIDGQGGKAFSVKDLMKGKIRRAVIARGKMKV